MMSSHGGNPIFFNKKIKIGRPEHSLTLPLRPITSHFCLTPLPLKVDVICVSPLKRLSKCPLWASMYGTNGS